MNTDWTLRTQLDTLATQLVDREAYLKLATNLEDFLAKLHSSTATATVSERQRILRLLVKDVLIGPERILIRHAIPTGGSTTTPTIKTADGDADEEPSRSCPLRCRSHIPLRPIFMRAKNNHRRAVRGQ